MIKLLFSKETVKIGDEVAVLFYHGNDIANIFGLQTGILKRLDSDGPYGCISGEEIVFASEGHNTIILKIVKNLNDQK